MRTYQEVSAQVIERYEGYIAQYLGDGLLVYFGYPTAHEDDAARSIHADLEILTALHQARSRLVQPVQVRRTLSNLRWLLLLSWGVYPIAYLLPSFARVEEGHAGEKAPAASRR